MKKYPQKPHYYLRMYHMKENAILCDQTVVVPRTPLLGAVILCELTKKAHFSDSWLLINPFSLQSIIVLSDIVRETSDLQKIYPCQSPNG